MDLDGSLEQPAGIEAHEMLQYVSLVRTFVITLLILKGQLKLGRRDRFSPDLVANQYVPGVKNVFDCQVPDLML